jgi:trehalose 6-phosphate synthase
VWRAEDFAAYRSANARFASAALVAAGNRPALMLVQDYHLALVPRLVAEQSGHTIVAFWHVPWPRPRTFWTCPWANALLDGLLGSDIVGFQTEDDCENFLGSVELLPGSVVDRVGRRVSSRGRTTCVRVYPAGIPWRHPVLDACPPVENCRHEVRRELNVPANIALAVGIDRLDYTKGINEKFLAVERLLRSRPHLRGRFVFAQIAEPSRDELPAYQATRAQLVDTAARVNSEYGQGTYVPIRLLERHHDAAEVYRYYRAADLCVVGSLHDGMNLVAKEFVAARHDERGVLVLSRLAGAARQLRAALLIDPRDVDATAAALERALDMPAAEQSMRMRTLRTQVATFDGAWWGRAIMTDAARLQENDLFARTSRGGAR